MSGSPREGPLPQDERAGRLSVLRQVTRTFAALAVIGLFLSVTELGGIGLRQDTLRGLLGLVAFGIGLYGLARWTRETRRIRRTRR